MIYKTLFRTNKLKYFHLKSNSTHIISTYLMNYLELASHSSFFDFWRVHKMSLVSNFAWTATNQRLVLFGVNQSEASITWPVTRLPLLTTLYPIFSKPLRTFKNQMVSPEQGEFKKDTFFSRKYFFYKMVASYESNFYFSIPMMLKQPSWRNTNFWR